MFTRKNYVLFGALRVFLIVVALLSYLRTGDRFDLVLILAYFYICIELGALKGFLGGGNG